MPARLPTLIPSPAAVERFKAIYDARFGGDLKPVTALELAMHCLLLADIGTHPFPASVEIIPPLR